MFRAKHGNARLIKSVVAKSPDKKTKEVDFYEESQRNHFGVFLHYGIFCFNCFRGAVETGLRGNQRLRHRHGNPFND